jgi:pimeloyl-ACP methyl ester carboxylesterase
VVLSVQIRGEGRPVVLLPWFSTDQAVMAAAFEPVFAAVSGWRRIYVDLPGTGGSPSTAPCSDAVLGSVVETVSALLGNASFLVAGCSYGGYLAAGLARQIPARIAGLLMVCAGVKILPGDRNLSGVLPSAQEAGWLDDVPPELHEHLSHAIGHQTRDVANRVARALGRGGPVREDYLAALRSEGYQLTDEGSHWCFDGNATILAGRQDRIAGHLDQFDALAHYCHGSFVALADAGHYLPFEQPARFKSITLDWLARNDPAPNGRGRR